MSGLPLIALASSFGIGRLHHIGFVVPSIDESIDEFRALFGSIQVSPTFVDPIQRAKVIFLLPEQANGTQIELVEPARDDSPASRLALQGGGLHHLCFEVQDLGAAVSRLRGQGHLVISKATPAIAFEGRRIQWIYTKVKLLIEIVEGGRTA